MADDVTQRVLETYPSLRFLLGDPEIGPLLVQAVDPNVGFSPQTFEARLHETTWWKTTPEPARQAQIQAGTDPATYSLNVQGRYNSLYDWAQKMGVAMSAQEMAYMSAGWTNRGGDVNDPTAQNDLNMWLKAHPERLQAGGGVNAAAHRVDQLSRTNWFMAPQLGNQVNWAIDLAMGKKTEADLTQDSSSYMASLYPHLGQRFAAGETLADIVNPYRDIVAKELELGSVDEVDMVNSTQWKWLTGMPQPDGTMRLPTAMEAQTAARRDPRWWATSGGRQRDAGMTRTLLEAFGKRAA